jgi:hypothetical protein
MATMVTLVANLAAAAGLDTDPAGARETLAWSFGLTTLGFGTVKLGIAVILIGIIARLWFRVDSVKAALLRLKPDPGEALPPVTGDIETDFGAATASTDVPELTFIHRMAKVMWAPMLVMGAMALVIGFVLSLVWTGETAGTETFRELGAWTQGLQFLGEGLLLGGISFLLGTILAGLRVGGGEVQESLGLTVKTLKMPATAKAFVVFMMMGVMVSIAQFVLYIVAASSADNAVSFSAWSSWLGPFRELGLGLLLIGIVLALVTIGNVLAFQFDRIKTIVRTGL